MEDKKAIVGFDGVCPVCGSMDGMIIHGKDGKYRTMCRVMGCPAWYKLCPIIGFDAIEDCRNPFDSEYLKDGTVSVEEYISGKNTEE
jgi:hypothetical protein